MAGSCIRFYRAELERQRDFHRGKGVLSWLLPVLPGPILFNLGFALDRPKFAPLVALQMAGFLILAAIVVAHQSQVGSEIPAPARGA